MDGGQERQHLKKTFCFFLPFLTVCIVINLALFENPFAFGIVGKTSIISMVLLIFWPTYIVTSKVNVSTKILSLDSAVICVFFAARFIYLAVLGVPCIFGLSKLLQHSYANFLVKHGLTDLRGLNVFFIKARILWPGNLLSRSIMP